MSLVLQSLLPFPHSCQGPSPHQQGRDERMIEQCFGGIDVSQDRLDVLLLPQGTGFSVANDEAGWSTLMETAVMSSPAVSCLTARIFARTIGRGPFTSTAS